MNHVSRAKLIHCKLHTFKQVYQHFQVRSMCSVWKNREREREREREMNSQVMLVSLASILSKGQLCESTQVNRKCLFKQWLLSIISIEFYGVSTFGFSECERYCLECLTFAGKKWEKNDLVNELGSDQCPNVLAVAKCSSSVWLIYFI